MSATGEGLMGGDPYCYFTRYQNDIQVALDALREQEFKAGRYYPAMDKRQMRRLGFPRDETLSGPGPQHASIAEAIDASEADGTFSILDIERITDSPGFASACPLPPDELIAMFGTAEPTRKQLETALLSSESEVAGFWEQIDRGCGRYVVLYDNGRPCEIFFVGYSWD